MSEVKRRLQDQCQPYGALQSSGNWDFFETRNKTGVKLFCACDVKSRPRKDLDGHHSDSMW